MARASQHLKGGRANSLLGSLAANVNLIAFHSINHQNGGEKQTSEWAEHLFTQPFFTLIGHTQKSSFKKC